MFNIKIYNIKLNTLIDSKDSSDIRIVVIVKIVVIVVIVVVVADCGSSIYSVVVL